MTEEKLELIKKAYFEFKDNPSYFFKCCADILNDIKEIVCMDCGIKVSGKLNYNGNPICFQCMKIREEIEA